jgi:hypothetical protein
MDGLNAPVYMSEKDVEDETVGGSKWISDENVQRDDSRDEAIARHVGERMQAIRKAVCRRSRWHRA